MRRLSAIYSYPELLFLELVSVLPVLVAAVWTFTWHCCSAWGFVGKWLACMAAGLVIWLAVIVLIVWPRFRD